MIRFDETRRDVARLRRLMCGMAMPFRRALFIPGGCASDPSFEA